MRYIEFNVPSPGLLIITPTGIEPTLEQYKDLVFEAQQILANNGPYYIIYDVNKRLVSNENRVYMINWMSKNMEFLGKAIRGMLIVGGSTWLTMILKQVNWKVEIPFPVHVCPTIADAFTLLKETYQFEGATVAKS